MRRDGFVLAGFLLAVAAAAFLISIATRPTVLRIAVGPANSDDARLAQALIPLLQRDGGKIRLRLAGAENPRRAAAMIDEGKADLALVRSDIAMPDDGLTVLIWRRATTLLIARADRGLIRIGDLRGRVIGAPPRAEEDVRLLRAILAHYEIPPDAARIVPIEPEDRGAALKEGRVDAIFAIGSAQNRLLSDSIAAMARAVGDAGLHFLPIREAAALAALNPALEASELVAGAFGGEPARPPEPTPTVSATVRLVAHRQLDEGLVGELTQRVLQARTQLSGETPAAQAIEAPPTDKDAPLPLHPGAAAYLDGEQETFFERYGDWFYLAVMAVSILGSGAAAMVSRMNSRRRAEAMAGLNRLLAVLREARAAGDEAALDALEKEADALLSGTLEHAACGDIDDVGLSAYRLAFDQTMRAIGERRDALAREAEEGA